MSTLRHLAVALVIAASIAPSGAFARPGLGERGHHGVALQPHAADVLLVAFDAATPSVERARVRASAGATESSPISPTRTDVERWHLPAGTDLVALMARLAGDPRVRYSEPDWMTFPAASSNDPFYTGDTLWGMHGDDIMAGANPFGTGADEAWAMGYTGSRSVYVGVIDTGIQWSHPDLSTNTWVNPGEIAGNAKDDDRNGYVDDVRGWDFLNGNATVYDGTASEGGDYHGTHVAGTIGAIGGNGIGVAGVNWQVTMIPAKFSGDMSGLVSNAIKATDYLVALKTKYNLNLVAINNSWASTGFSQTLLASIDAAGDQGILYVAAAGNDGISNDPTPSYPSSYECTKGGTRGWDCVVSVAAIDSAGRRASISSYGRRSVDLGAPGVGIMSTWPVPAPGDWASQEGTSMAAPHVAGAVALCASINPALTARQRKEAILGSVAPTDALGWLTLTGGRLDIGAMARVCAPAIAAPTGAPADLTAGVPILGEAPAVGALALRWSDGVSGESLYEIQAAVAANGACGTYRSVAFVRADATAATLPDLSGGTSYCIRVRGTTNYLGTSASAWSPTVVAQTQAPPAPYLCARAPLDWVDPSSGTNLGLTDESTATLALPDGFGFSSHGLPWRDLTVSSNGFIRRGLPNGTWPTNGSIPSPLEPNGIVAPAWDDWDPGVDGAITVRTTGTSPNRRFVISWLNVYNAFSRQSPASFQAILEEGGDVVRFQYLDMSTGSFGSDFGGYATAGIESWDGAVGTQISKDTRSLTDGTAFRCSSVPAGPAPTISTTALGSGTTGTNYATSLVATGGRSPYAWSLASGSLPPGLSLSTGGTIAGVPASGGTYSFTVRVIGDDLSSSTRALSLTVVGPAITTTSLATATAGAAYGPVSLAVSGGQAPYTWALGGGGLPSGVSISSAGVLSGIPTESGTFSPTVRVTDGAGRTATRPLTLTVNFGKLTPANGATLASGTTQAALSWATHLISGFPATKYRYCVASSASTCPNSWIEISSGTSGSKPVLGGQTWYWQVQAWNGSTATWVPANGGTAWKFSVAR